MCGHLIRSFRARVGREAEFSRHNLWISRSDAPHRPGMTQIVKKFTFQPLLVCNNGASLGA
jgi:hypothetical protein